MKRHWKLWLTLFVVVYLAVSWAAFLLPPRIRASSDVPAEAIKAVSEYCGQDDYLWDYPWGIPASVFWAEPIFHRELRTREIVLQRVTDTRIRAYCRSTDQAVWFDRKDQSWELDPKMLLTF
jgi:hypothetical protein